MDQGYLRGVREGDGPRALEDTEIFAVKKDRGYRPPKEPCSWPDPSCAQNYHVCSALSYLISHAACKLQTLTLSLCGLSRETRGLPEMILREVKLGPNPSKESVSIPSTHGMTGNSISSEEWSHHLSQELSTYYQALPSVPLATSSTSILRN